MGVLTLPLPLTLGQGQSGAFVSETGPEAPRARLEGPHGWHPTTRLGVGTSPTRGTFGESTRTGLPTFSLTLGWAHFGKQGAI